jgi:hypothetical protein
MRRARGRSSCSSDHATDSGSRLRRRALGAGMAVPPLQPHVHWRLSKPLLQLNPANRFSAPRQYATWSGVRISRNPLTRCFESNLAMNHHFFDMLGARDGRRVIDCALRMLRLRLGTRSKPWSEHGGVLASWCHRCSFDQCSGDQRERSGAGAHKSENARSWWRGAAVVARMGAMIPAAIPAICSRVGGAGAKFKQLERWLTRPETPRCGGRAASHFANERAALVVATVPSRGDQKVAGPLGVQYLRVCAMRREAKRRDRPPVSQCHGAFCCRMLDGAANIEADVRR